MKINLLDLYNHIKNTHGMVIITGNKDSIDEFVKDNDIELKDYKSIGVDSLYRFEIGDIKNSKTIFVMVNENYSDISVIINYI